MLLFDVTMLQCACASTLNLRGLCGRRMTLRQPTRQPRSCDTHHRRAREKASKTLLSLPESAHASQERSRMSHWSCASISRRNRRGRERNRSCDTRGSSRRATLSSDERFAVSVWLPCGDAALRHACASVGGARLLSRKSKLERIRRNCTD